MSDVPRSLLSHGSHEMCLSGNLLSVEAYGPWNREAAEEYCEKVRELTSNLIKERKDWAVYIAIHGTGIYTPDSIQLLKDLHLWRLENGMKHIAIICSDNDSCGTDILKKQLNPVYSLDDDDDDDHVEKYFKDRSVATKWLRQLGFGIEDRCCIQVKN